MIIPRNEEEGKKFEEMVKQNDEADDWVSEDISFSVPSVPRKPLDILKKVVSRRLPPKK